MIATWTALAAFAGGLIVLLALGYSFVTPQHA
jgi:hypothetical protein